MAYPAGWPQEPWQPWLLKSWGSPTQVLRTENYAHLRDCPIYPFQQVAVTWLSPDGGSKAVRNMVDTAFPQLATILKSAADVFRVGPEQVSPFLYYNRPTTPGYNAAKYAAGIGSKYGALLGGADEDLVLDAMKEAAKEAAIDIGKSTAIDIATQATPVGGALVKVGISMIENKDLLKTTEGRAQLAMNAGFTIASMVPVLNVAAIAAQLVTGAVGFIEARSEMKEQMKIADEFMKMIQNNLDIATNEARGLSMDLSARGVSLSTDNDTAWTGRLRAHYENLALAEIDDWNKSLDMQKAEYIVAKGMEISFDPKALDKFDHVKREVNYISELQFFLQFARDMRRLREALAGQLKPQGSATKSPEAVVAEIQQIAAAMLAQNPLLPIQEALNLAAATARGSSAPITQPEAAAAFAQGVAQKVQTNSAVLVGGGAMALLAAVKFLPMLLRR